MDVGRHRERLRAAEDAWVNTTDPSILEDFGRPEDWRSRVANARLQYLYSAGDFTPQDLYIPDVDMDPPDHFWDPDVDINAFGELIRRLNVDELAIVARLLEVASAAGRRNL
jgi:hypothetical protein